MGVFVELFDACEPLLNVLGPMLFQPEKVLYLYVKNEPQTTAQTQLRSFFQSAGQRIDIDFIAFDSWDAFSLYHKLIDLLADLPDAMVDVSGGDDLMLVAAGMALIKKNSFTLIHSNLAKNVCHVWYPNVRVEEVPIEIKMPVSQAIAMAGGRLCRQGHGGAPALNANAMALTAKAFQLFVSHRDRWHSLTQYLQAASNYQDSSDSLYIRAPKRISNGGARTHAPLSVLGALAQSGLLTRLRFNEHEISFRYAHSFLQEYLPNAGIWLELYIYRAAVLSGRFDDVQMSAVIAWDNTEANAVENEVDVIATAGLTQLFISCKTGPVDWRALHEIQTLTARFGSQCAVPVLVAMEAGVSMVNRAANMGIALILPEELVEGTLQKRLCRLAARWNCAAESLDTTKKELQSCPN